MRMTFGCYLQVNSSMILYFFPNDDCAVVYCIGRIYIFAGYEIDGLF